MPQNAFGGRAPPGPAVGPPADTLVGFKGMGGEGMREKGEGKEGLKGKREGRGGKKEGKGKGSVPPQEPVAPFGPNYGTLEPPLPMDWLRHWR